MQFQTTLLIIGQFYTLMNPWSGDIRCVFRFGAVYSLTRCNLSVEKSIWSRHGVQPRKMASWVPENSVQLIYGLE